MRGIMAELIMAGIAESFAEEERMDRLAAEEERQRAIEDARPPPNRKQRRAAKARRRKQSRNEREGWTSWGNEVGGSDGA